MKLKIYNIIWLVAFLLLFPINAFAVSTAPKMQCTYTGNIPETPDIIIKTTITLDSNGQTSFSNPVLMSDYADIDECRSGASVNDCYKKVSGTEFFIDNVRVIELADGYYSEIEAGSSSYTSTFVDNNKYTCPNTLTMLKHKEEGKNTYSFYLTNNNFSKSNCKSNQIGNFSCQDFSTLTITGSKIETTYDGSSINTGNSSGSCCVYTYNNLTYVYAYKFTSNTGATSYAVCLGENCITNEPNKSKNAQYMSVGDDSRWENYQTMSNCSNMPENLWYATDSSGKKIFFPYYANKSESGGNTVRKLTLQPNSYCESKIYSSDGIVKDDSTDSNTQIDWDNKADVNCEGIIGDDMLDFINMIFRWIQIIAPIIVIVLGGIDFAGAILKDDKDALKKASSKFIKRLIIAVILFFVPLILSWLLNIFNDVTGAASSTCHIGE